MICTSPKSLADQMIGHYGPTLGGHDLYAALGFKSYSAFHRSKLREEIGVNVFTLPGRRGWFALTTEIAVWLEAQAEAKTSLAREINAASNEGGGV